MLRVRTTRSLSTLLSRWPMWIEPLAKGGPSWKTKAGRRAASRAGAPCSFAPSQRWRESFSFSAEVGAHRERGIGQVERRLVFGFALFRVGRIHGPGMIRDVAVWGQAPTRPRGAAPAAAAAGGVQSAPSLDTALHALEPAWREVVLSFPMRTVRFGRTEVEIPANRSRHLGPRRAQHRSRQAGRLVRGG